MKMTALQSFETSGNTRVTTRRHFSEGLLASSNRRTRQSQNHAERHGERHNVACVTFARTNRLRLDLASSWLHMWFSPSVTLAERQREEETLADCRTHSILITNCC